MARQVGQLFHLWFMPECVSERSAVCICYPFTGVLADAITNGDFVTVTNLAALLVCDR